MPRCQKRAAEPTASSDDVIFVCEKILKTSNPRRARKSAPETSTPVAPIPLPVPIENIKREVESEDEWDASDNVSRPGSPNYEPTDYNPFIAAGNLTVGEFIPANTAATTAAAEPPAEDNIEVVANAVAAAAAESVDKPDNELIAGDINDEPSVSNNNTNASADANEEPLAATDAATATATATADASAAKPAADSTAGEPATETANATADAAKPQEATSANANADADAAEPKEADDTKADADTSTVANAGTKDKSELKLELTPSEADEEDSDRSQHLIPSTTPQRSLIRIRAPSPRRLTYIEERALSYKEDLRTEIHEIQTQVTDKLSVEDLVILLHTYRKYTE